MDLSFYSNIFRNQPQILDLARKQSTALGPESEGNVVGMTSLSLLAPALTQDATSSLLSYQQHVRVVDL
jgi:hypothetical protein